MSLLEIRPQRRRPGLPPGVPVPDVPPSFHWFSLRPIYEDLSSVSRTSPGLYPTYIPWTTPPFSTYTPRTLSTLSSTLTSHSSTAGPHKSPPSSHPNRTDGTTYRRSGSTVRRPGSRVRSLKTTTPFPVPSRSSVPPSTEVSRHLLLSTPLPRSLSRPTLTQVHSFPVHPHVRQLLPYVHSQRT